MAITYVMGFDDVLPRIDNEIPDIEGSPFRFVGSANNLRVLAESTSILRVSRGGEGRRVVRLTNTGSVSAGVLTAPVSELLGEHANERTRWVFGYRLRYESNITSRQLGAGGGMRFTSPTVNVFTSAELEPYMVSDRYTYFEAMFDWHENVIRRWVDGYSLSPLPMSASLVQNPDQLKVSLGTYHASGNTTYCRLTDFYALVDTSHIEGDESPSERLGGAFVRSLKIDEAELTDQWRVSNVGTAPETILNNPMSTTIGSRLSPYLITSVGENPAFFRLATPTPGLMQRLGRGDIKFVQVSLNAHRFNGSTAALYANVIQDDVDVSTPEQEMTMYVDGYEGRPVTALNAPLAQGVWTPEQVHQHRVRVYSESGGGGA